MLRVFVALWPPIEVSEPLADLAQRTLSTRETREVRATKPHRIHLTLAFLGDITGRQVEQLASELESSAALATAPALSLDHAGHFSDHVLWVGAREPVDELRSLAKVTRVAARAAGLSVQGKDFAPHLTVGRTRGEAVLATAVDELTATLQERPIGWLAHELCVVSSVRAPSASYEVLERWRLAPGLG